MAEAMSPTWAQGSQEAPSPRLHQEAMAEAMSSTWAHGSQEARGPRLHQEEGRRGLLFRLC
jgi:hypothetical protein